MRKSRNKVPLRLFLSDLVNQAIRQRRTLLPKPQLAGALRANLLHARTPGRDMIGTPGCDLSQESMTLDGVTPKNPQFVPVKSLQRITATRRCHQPHLGRLGIQIVLEGDVVFGRNLVDKDGVHSRFAASLPDVQLQFAHEIRLPELLPGISASLQLTADECRLDNIDSIRPTAAR